MNRGIIAIAHAGSETLLAMASKVGYIVLHMSLNLQFNALFQKAREGDDGAEAELYRLLFDRFVIITKHRIREATLQECEDIAQDACKTLIEKYREREPETGFTSWAYTILRNKIGNAYQHRRAASQLQYTDDFDAVARTEEPADPLLVAAIRECFQRLASENRRYARVLNLAHQSYTTQEICERLGLTPSNCFSMLSRARKRLLDCLKHKGVAL